MMAFSLVFFLFFSMFSWLCAQHESRSYKLNRSTVKINSIIAPSKYYFSYQNRMMMDASGIQAYIDHICKDSDKYENLFSDMFDSQTDFPISSYSPSLPIYLVLYKNLSVLTNGKYVVDEMSPQYALSLLCSFRYEEAQKTALCKIKNDKDNYGLLIILGLLSTRNKSLFPYLERAFEQNPLKTLCWVDWQISYVEIAVSPPDEWDFLDAYVKMIIRKPAIFNNAQLPPRVAYRLYSAICLKYYDNETYEILAEQLPIKQKLEQLKRYLQFIFKGRYPPKNSRVQYYNPSLQRAFNF